MSKVRVVVGDDVEWGTEASGLSVISCYEYSVRGFLPVPLYYCTARSTVYVPSAERRFRLAGCFDGSCLKLENLKKIVVWFVSPDPRVIYVLHHSHKKRKKLGSHLTAVRGCLRTASQLYPNFSVWSQERETQASPRRRAR